MLCVRGISLQMGARAGMRVCAGRVSFPPVTSRSLANHVWQLKQGLSLADAGSWVLSVSSAGFEQVNCPRPVLLLSSIEMSI